MKKYILFGPVLVGAIVLGTISWWQIARSEPLNDSFRQSAVERLNASAKAAKDDDVAAVESLSTTLIANLIPVELPDELRTTIQTRLVAAELDYRRGGKGIPDAQVVRTINELAKEFAAPEYAKTTPRPSAVLTGDYDRRLPATVGSSTHTSQQNQRVRPAALVTNGRNAADRFDASAETDQ